jgi:hypothetical protein
MDEGRGVPGILRPGPLGGRAHGAMRPKQRARDQSHRDDHDHRQVVGHADNGHARTPRQGPAHDGAGDARDGPSRQRACPSLIV